MGSPYGDELAGLVRVGVEHERRRLGRLEYAFRTMVGMEHGGDDNVVLIIRQ